MHQVARCSSIAFVVLATTGIAAHSQADTLARETLESVGLSSERLQRLSGTWFWIDPKEDLVFIGMIQQFGQNRPDVRSLSRRLTYQAILEPKP